MIQYDEKQFQKDLDEAMEKANAEIMEEFDKDYEEFCKTDYAKEIDTCKTPEDFMRVMKKYHPERFSKDGKAFFID